MTPLLELRLIDLNALSWTRRGAAALAIAAAVAAHAGKPSSDPCLPGEALPDQVLIELEGSTAIADVLAAIQPDFPTVTVLEAAPELGYFVLAAPPPVCELDLIAALMAVPGVEEADFNEIGQTSESQSQSFFFALESDYSSQYAWPLLGLSEAHAVSLGEGALVAIIDTGLDASHPVFAGATILAGLDFVGDELGAGDLGDGIDNDNDGVTDEMVGHGTFVAGLIHTIAPQATILPLRAIDTEGNGSAFAVAQAVGAALAAGADVINLSFSSTDANDLLSSMIEQAQSAGVVVVTAAGNSSVIGEAPFPADMSGILAVAATNAKDIKADFSNAGGFVDLSAPGVAIASTMPADAYAFTDGTSMAAAMVSGGAALVRAHEPLFTGAQIRAKLKSSAVPIDALNPGLAGKLGAGRLDLAAAVDALTASADLDGDGAVNGADLGLLIGAWGTAAADLNGDGTTNGSDLGILLAAWTR
ncbi:MAG: S8 family serine peptidase [Phycisphaerales bacterium]|nr:S8 family serine peptidase [Phycisphaerales bacterium]